MDGGAALRLPTGVGDPNVSGLTADSRAVQAGYLFAALPGTHADGKRFVSDAIARGAVAVLANDADGIADTVPLVTDANPRRQFARMAARFYAPQPKTVAAVTGTN